MAVDWGFDSGGFFNVATDVLGVRHILRSFARMCAEILISATYTLRVEIAGRAIAQVDGSTI
jgi:hypothetical protein